MKAHQAEKDGISYPAIAGLQVFLGLAIVLGTAAFGLIVVKNSMEW